MCSAIAAASSAWTPRVLSTDLIHDVTEEPVLADQHFSSLG